jgi:hypothetical protein
MMKSRLDGHEHGIQLTKASNVKGTSGMVN